MTPRRKTEPDAVDGAVNHAKFTFWVIRSWRDVRPPWFDMHRYGESRSAENYRPSRAVSICDTPDC